MLNDRTAGQRVRDLLLRLLNKQLIIFLFFLALSLAFWLLLTLNQTYERELPCAVRLSGVPENVVITTNVSDTVTVTVRDKGFMLLPYYTSNRLHPISLSFATYTTRQRGRGQVPLADLRKLIAKQLLSSAQITNVKADNLEFYYNFGQKKEVKVALQGNIVPSNNYYLAQVHFSPERVTIYADDAALDTITAVQTSYLNIVGFTDTVTRSVPLKAVKGVKMVPQTVKVTFYPDVLTEESAEVPVTTINVPDGVTLRTFPQRVTVSFTVGASMYRTLNLEEFRVVADYTEIAGHTSDKCTLHLTAKPSGVSKARLDIAQVDYLIEQ